MIAAPTRKICMLGDFGVGKTSLVARFAHNTFSGKYLTTVGVKVDSKTITLPGERKVTLVLWDFAGKDVIGELDQDYLRGAHGLILVVDGTREATLGTALQLRSQACDLLGEMPAVLLLNKVDLIDRWEFEPNALNEARSILPVFETSAKTGAAVEQVFSSLALRALR